MAFKRRGPREWRPGMKEGSVSLRPGREFQLRLVREILSEADLPPEPGFRLNAETGLHRKDPMELYEVLEFLDGQFQGIAGQMLWYPKFRRGGLLLRWHDQDGDAKWTDADNPLEVLERWVSRMMTD